MVCDQRPKCKKANYVIVAIAMKNNFFEMHLQNQKFMIPHNYYDNENNIV